MNDVVDNSMHEVHTMRKTPMNIKKVTKEVIYVGKSKNKSKKNATAKKKKTGKKNKSYEKNKVVVMGENKNKTNDN